jgi:hypothetical protein
MLAGIFCCCRTSFLNGHYWQCNPLPHMDRALSSK